ncbi:hypothetical protein D5F01_LYC22736 [Larimichthys crocea]|uniref:Uncharacterized protein n=1 Tax=Larimichthys crocea TaxID=215358 RepID=A0A6G0HJ10_LARCR|nr:hypothetical protein D5F01_LYC22736 [Larimichthys crocea]
MLMGRKPRSHLDLLHPDVGARREEKKSRKGGETKSFFKPGDWVFNKDFSQGPPWLAGVICRQTGPVSFMVDLWDSRQIRRHQGHLRSGYLSTLHGQFAPKHSPCVYLDNILVTGGMEEEHLSNLGKVLKRMADAGLWLKSRDHHEAPLDHQPQQPPHHFHFRSTHGRGLVVRGQGSTWILQDAHSKWLDAHVKHYYLSHHKDAQGHLCYSRIAHLGKQTN